MGLEAMAMETEHFGSPHEESHSAVLIHPCSIEANSDLQKYLDLDVASGNGRGDTADVGDQDQGDSMIIPEEHEREAMEEQSLPQQPMADEVIPFYNSFNPSLASDHNWSDVSINVTGHGSDNNVVGMENVWDGQDETMGQEYDTPQLTTPTSTIVDSSTEHHYITPGLLIGGFESDMVPGVQSSLELDPLTTSVRPAYTIQTRRRAKGAFDSSAPTLISAPTPTTPRSRTVAGRNPKVYCVCRQPDDGNIMIQCDVCKEWFHGKCVNITDDIAALSNEKYFCPTCEKITSDAKNRSGVKPVTVGDTGKRQHARTLSKDVDTFSEPKVCLLPECTNEARKKDVYCSDECAMKDSDNVWKRLMAGGGGGGDSPSKTSSIVEKGRQNKPEPEPSITDVRRPSISAESTTMSDPVRRVALKGLIEILTPVYESAYQDEHPTDEISPKEKAEEMAGDIERELYSQLAVLATDGRMLPGKEYKTKFRSLQFNLKDKSNDLLRTRILSGELPPAELVKMSTEELANPELKSMAETIRKRSIHDSVLVDVPEPLIKKTHKGEIQLGDNFDSMSVRPSPVRTAEEDESTEISITVAAEKKDSLDEILAKIKKRASEDSGSGGGLNYNSSKPSKRLTVDTESWAADDLDMAAMELTSPTTPLVEKFSQPDIVQSESPSRLEQSPSALSATALTVPTSVAATTIWTGQVVMPQVAKFQCHGRQIAGREIQGTKAWEDILALTISIDGRIPVESANKYLLQQKHSSTKEVVAVQFLPNDNGEDAAQFKVLFDYFHSRTRYGVVPNHYKTVKDMYIVPIAPSDALPEYLGPIGHTIPRLRDTDIIMGVIVLVKSSRSAPATSVHPVISRPVAVPQHKKRGTPPQGPTAVLADTRLSVTATGTTPPTIATIPITTATATTITSTVTTSTPITSTATTIAIPATTNSIITATANKPLSIANFYQSMTDNRSAAITSTTSSPSSAPLVSAQSQSPTNNTSNANGLNALLGQLLTHPTLGANLATLSPEVLKTLLPLANSLNGNANSVPPSQSALTSTPPHAPQQHMAQPGLGANNIPQPRAGTIDLATFGQEAYQQHPHPPPLQPYYTQPPGGPPHQEAPGYHPYARPPPQPHSPVHPHRGGVPEPHNHRGHGHKHHQPHRGRFEARGIRGGQRRW